MHPVYATRLSVHPREAELPAACFARLAGVIQQWVVEQTREHGCVVVDVDPSSMPGAWLPGDAAWRILDAHQQPVGQINSWALDPISAHGGEPARAWQWSAALPLSARDGAEEATSLLLRTEVQAREATEIGEGPHGWNALVVIRQFVATDDDGARPHEAEIPPPTLISRLVESFAIFRGSIAQTLGYWRIPLENVGPLVRLIQRPSRSLPIVVVSPSSSGQLLVDANAIGGMLLGIAKVAVLETPRAAAEFGRLIPFGFRCFNGAVRVFNARFSPQDGRDRHHCWLPDQISGHKDRFTGQCYQYLIRETAKWIGVDHVIVDLPRDRLQRGIMASLAREREQEALASEFEELSRFNDTVIEQLRADLATKDEELRARGDELYRLRARIADLEDVLHGHGSGAEALAGPALDAPAIPLSLLDAVRIAKAEADPTAIEFLPCAFDSAEHVQIDDPNDALTKLRALCGIAKTYHDQRGSGTSVMEAFKEQNIDYTPKVNASTKGQHRSDYSRTWTCHGKTRKIDLGPHIRLSQRHRVYWYQAASERKFVVGHVGDHLPDSTTG